ncbi:MAG: glycine cleavage system protein GcvH [Nitrososphaeria archaeon]|nr:glycine cleavage system protein GcvH [Nitrososphaeria archaeon]MDW8021176.1 glycine cleavage system protein GcvH [Nitrososphaerota archaeon]
MAERYEVREGYLYTRDHEWIKVEDRVITIGITDYGQSKLRDIVHVELPDIGESVEEGEVIATIESIKAVSEIYSPAAGRIIDVNVKLTDNPELVNEDPYEKGWIVKMELAEERTFGDLMEADEYRRYLEDLEEAV